MERGLRGLSCGVERREEAGWRVGRSPLEKCWHRNNGKNYFFLVLFKYFICLSQNALQLLVSILTICVLSNCKKKKGVTRASRKSKEQSSQGRTLHFKVTPANKWVL